MRSPIIRYGGKGMLVSKLLPLIPTHTTYVEPFCGGASLLFAKGISAVEVLNDMDHTLVLFFKMLRDKPQELISKLQLSPYSRHDYKKALKLWRVEGDEVERMRFWFILNRQAFGGVYGSGWSHSVTGSRRGISKAVSAWLSAIDGLAQVVERLQLAQIECLDYEQCIIDYDRKETFFYCDPPYVQTTRSALEVYRHEMTEQDHTHLIDLLLTIKGRVMLSGYRNELYNRLEYAGWVRVDFKTHCHTGTAGASNRPERIESVWLDPKTAQEVI